MTLDAIIEAILFFKAEPLPIARLVEISGAAENEVNEALDSLQNKLVGRGVILVRGAEEVSLGTAPEASDLLNKMTKDELSRELGKSALETLTVVLYKGPLSKPEIDFIRGVNSSYILRNLLVRGLVEKIQNPKDQRSFLYRPTLELFRYLGVAKREDLPEFGEFQKKSEESFNEFLQKDDTV